MHPDSIRDAAIDALQDIKAKDIVILDVRKMTAMFDYVVVASAESTRQARALVSHLQEKVKTLGANVYGVEGEGAGEWVLVDLGDVIVHVMQPAVRAYYNLEQLWGGKGPVHHGRPLERQERPAARP